MQHDITSSLTNPVPSDFSLEVYPNQGIGNFSINLLDNKGQTGDLCIFNLAGQLVHKEVISTDEKMKSLNLTGFPDGKYILHIMLGEKNIRESLIIAH